MSESGCLMSHFPDDPPPSSNGICLTRLGERRAVYVLAPALLGWLWPVDNKSEHGPRLTADGSSLSNQSPTYQTSRP